MAAKKNTSPSRQPRTIIDTVFEQVALAPNALCLSFEGTTVSRAQFLAKAVEIAQKLLDAGVGRGDLVMVRLPRSARLVAASFGVLLAGATYVPIDRGQPRKRLSALLELLKPAAAIMDGEELSVSDHAPPLVMQVDDEFHEEYDGEFAGTRRPEPSDVAYVICTSGSTGTPKGVQISHAALANYSFWAAREYEMARLQGACLSSGIGFDGTLLSQFVPLVAGCPILIAPEGKDIEFVAELLQPGSQWNGLLNSSPSHLDAISPLVPAAADAERRCVFVVGGETVTSRSILPWMERFPKSLFVNEYGPTETTVACTYHRIRPEDLAAGSIPIGHAIDGMEVTIVDPDMNVVPDGNKGELLISGVGVADGYIGVEGHNSQRFVVNRDTGQRAYRSGDIGYRTADGVLQFGGRGDDQIKLRGFRIEIEEVRIQLAQWPDLAASAVFLHQTEKISQLVAFGVKASSQASMPDTEAMLRFLGDRLPDYMIPSRLILVDRLPVTASGKVDRDKLLGELTQRGRPHQVDIRQAGSVLADIWDELLGCGLPSRNDNFFELGGSSVKATQMIALIQRRLGVRLRPAQVFERYRFGELLDLISKPTPSPKAPTQVVATSREAAIAVIGIGLRFPGAESWEEFWKNLIDKKESITFFADEELDLAVRAIADEPGYVKARGIIEHADEFDAGFFNMTPAEASLLDPQHRVFLEVCWAAMEDAGYPPAGPQNVGVFAGCGSDTYTIQNVVPKALADGDLIDLPTRLFNDKDYLTSRISHKFNLTGPSVNINTACSTSLVAVVLAVKALRDGLCDMALAGGVSVDVPIKAGYRYVEGSMLSPDGHCRPFDSQAAGTMFNSGAGAVLLKPLDQALRDQDRIFGVIRGVGINNDGGSKSSFAAPSIDGQAAAVRMAVNDAGIEPDSLHFVETHGTGTPIGDPIEVEGLSRVFDERGGRTQFCALGSVKSNVGHMVAAAGVAGLIKAILSLRHGVYPATLHFNEPNPHIDFTNSPFFVAKDHVALREHLGTIRGGVSSFGVGGTNAHVIVESIAEQRVPESHQDVMQPVPPYRIFPFSARSKDSLACATSRFGELLKTTHGLDLRDVAYTLQERRSPMQYRAAIVADSRESLMEAIKQGPLVTEIPKHRLPLVFMFTGQGCQYPGMARELAAKYPVFAGALEQCFEALNSYHTADFRDLLLGEPDESKVQQLADTANAQPAILAVEYAIYSTLLSLDIKPDRVLGHSIGEFTAAVAAGVMSLEDAIAAVCERGRLMGSQPPGSMLAVLADRAKAEQFCTGDVELAAFNAPGVHVVSGPKEPIEQLAKSLEKSGISAKRLNTSHAFHSRMMDPAVEPMIGRMGALNLKSPIVELISTLTADAVTEQMADPTYWGKQLRNPVRFQDALENAASHGRSIWLEVGPGTHLTTLARQILTNGAHVVIPACSRVKDGEEYGFCDAIAQLWRHGVNVNWGAFQNDGAKVVSLPTYAFSRKRHWIEPPATSRAGVPSSVGLAESKSEEIEELIQLQIKTMEGQLRLISQLDRNSS